MDDIGLLTSALAGRYEIDRELGAGGMATVYLAHDLRHNRRVALKVLRHDVAQSIGSERFLREIQFAASLAHPHILPMFDSGDADGILYYVMPNVEGQSLRDRLDCDGKVAIGQAVLFAQQVADALDYAHRHGIVHRDVKPENIMLHDGYALVADFGIGKALSDVEEDGMTQAGMSVGTPAYMSPEQAAGDPVDGRTDIYSLGCVLYEMLTGEQPFTGPNVQAVIAKRFIQVPADVSGIRDGVSRGLANAVRRALALSRDDRFESGAQFAAALAQSSQTARVAAPDKSIAVLPFANMSADPENEFFADGVTEEILNALAQIPELRVAGRTSSFSFKGKNVDLRSIGDQLSVQTVLEGSVRKAGKRVRITAQLINVADGYHLLSERYDREIEDVFAVQDEIASAIAARLKVTLGGGSEAREQRATDNIDAYEAYLKGRALLYHRGAAVNRGIELMEKSLALDPNYGLAWAGLADAYTILGYMGQMNLEAGSAKARWAADHALRAAPDLAEAHSARAMVALMFDWDFAAAESGFRLATALNPRYVQGAAWYYIFFIGFASQRWPTAIRSLLELQTIEPLSGYIAAVLAICLTHTEDTADALRWSERALELEPNSFLAMWSRQLALHHAGDYTGAITWADTVLAASGRHGFSLQTLAASHAANGEAEYARAVYDEMRARSRREPMPMTWLATAAAGVGEEALALEHASDAMARHEPAMIMFSRSALESACLRELPEFQAALRSVGFPD